MECDHISMHVGLDFVRFLQLQFWFS